MVIYAMDNDPQETLLERVAVDFPKEKLPVAAAVRPQANMRMGTAATRAGWIEG